MIDRGGDIGFCLREEVGIGVDGDALSDGAGGQNDVERRGAYAGDADRSRLGSLASVSKPFSCTTTV